MANSSDTGSIETRPATGSNAVVGPATPRGHRNSNADWEFPFATPGQWKGRKKIPGNTEKRNPFGDMESYDATKIPPRYVRSPVSMAEFKEAILALGVDDVGIISIDNPAIAHELEEVRYVYPHARSLVIMVGEENKPSMQSRYLPTANHELYHCEERLFHWGQAALKYLRTLGAEGLTTTVGWPQEVSQRWTDKIWPLSHKLVAQAAGLGVIGTSRNFLHKKFGAYVLLDTILTNIEFEPSEYEASQQLLDWNPCIQCNLCVASCPTSAIKGSGEFDFMACYNHTYRDSIPGFLDLMRDLAESKSPEKFNHKWSDTELAALWQSMAYKVEYRCFNCVATCPAEIHYSYHNEKGVRGNYLKDVLKPLTHVRFNVEERFVIDTPSARETYNIPPGKYRTAPDITRIGNTGVRLVPLYRMRTSNIDSMMRLMPFYFRSEESLGLDFTAQINLSGEGGGSWVLRVVDERCSVAPGVAPSPDLTISCSGAVFLAVHRGEASPVWTLLTGQVRLSGRKSLYLTFGRLFPVRPPSSVFHSGLWHMRRWWRRQRVEWIDPAAKRLMRSKAADKNEGK